VAEATGLDDAEDLHRAIAEAGGTAPALAKVEAALRALVALGRGD
jgi:hypothetical protein